MMNDLATFIITLIVVMWTMYIFYLERSNASVLSEMADIISFVMGAYFGYIGAKLKQKNDDEDKH